MKAVVQRVKQGKVTSEDEILGEINQGLVVLLGVSEGDNEQVVEKTAEKILKLRIFPSAGKNIDRSVQEVEGEMLVVPQFTLCADISQGNRPSFLEAAEPGKAKKLYLDFVDYLKENSGLKVTTGEFGAMMDVSLINDGPVTIVLEQ